MLGLQTAIRKIHKQKKLTLFYILFSCLRISFPESATEFTATLQSATGAVITIFIVKGVLNNYSVKESLI